MKHFYRNPLVLLLLLFITARMCYAQEIYERVMYSDNGVSAEPWSFGASAIAQTNDHGYVIGGWKQDGNAIEALIIRTRPNGTILWSKKLDALVSVTDVTLNTNNTITLIGKTNSSPSAIAIMLLSESGSPLKETSYLLNAQFEMYSHKVASDGGHLICAITYDSVIAPFGMLLKISAAGAIEWNAMVSQLPSMAIVTPLTVVEAADHSVIVAGTMADQTRAKRNHLWVAHYNASGQLLQHSEYTDPTFDLIPSTIILLSNGLYAISGHARNISKATDSPLLVLVRPDLTIAHATTTQLFSEISELSSAENTSQLIETSTGILAVHSTVSFPYENPFPYSPCYLLKYQLSGALLTVTQRTDTSSTYGGLHLFPLSNGGYQGIGTQYYGHGYIGIGVFTLTNELVGCSLTPTLAVSTPLTLQQRTPDELTMGTRTMQTFSDTVMPLAEYFYIGTDIICQGPVSSVESSYQEYSGPVLAPNPVSRSSYITVHGIQVASEYYTIILRDLTGRVLYQTNKAPESSEELRIPTTGLVSGIYIVELADANSFTTVWRGKVVIE